MTIQHVKRIVEISSNIGRSCEVCYRWIGHGSTGGALAESVNHYLDAHGYHLLHVGTQSEEGVDGKVWHHTVAILGYEPPPRPVHSALADFPEEQARDEHDVGG